MGRKMKVLKAIGKASRIIGGLICTLGGILALIIASSTSTIEFIAIVLVIIGGIGLIISKEKKEILEICIMVIGINTIYLIILIFMLIPFTGGGLWFTSGIIGGIISLISIIFEHKK